MDCFNQSFLIASWFIILNELVHTLLYHERIQGIEKYLLFMRITTVGSDVCIPVVDLLVPILTFYFDHKEYIVCKFRSYVFVSTGWKKPEIEDNISDIFLIELNFLVTCSCSSITHQAFIEFCLLLILMKFFDSIE